MPTDQWEFSYAGVTLPPPDSGGLSLELQPIDDFERNANGDAMIESVTMKSKLSYTLSQADGEQSHKILNTLKQNRSGKLRYFDIADNSIAEINAYWGAGAKINYLRWTPELEKSMYGAISVNFIET